MAEGPRETARLVHKDFFDKCQFAIDQGFYLEAMVMEYSAIENRMKIIMGIVGMPCTKCDDTNITYSIGLNKKIGCLRCFLSNKEVFEKSKLTTGKLNQLKDWCNSRNERIHRLYNNTEKYERMMSRNKKYAIKGLEFARLFYAEANRLKYMQKKHPEKMRVKKFECQEPFSFCIEAKEWIIKTEMVR